MNLDETIKVTIERINKTSERIEKYECSKCNAPRFSTRCESCPFGQIIESNNQHVLTLQDIYRKAF